MMQLGSYGGGNHFGECEVVQLADDAAMRSTAAPAASSNTVPARAKTSGRFERALVFEARTRGVFSTTGTGSGAGSKTGAGVSTTGRKIDPGPVPGAGTVIDCRQMGQLIWWPT